MFMQKKLLPYMHFICCHSITWICYIAIFFHALFHLIGKYNRHAMESMLTEDSISLLLHGVVNLFPLVQVSSLNQVNSLNSSSIRFQISISYDLHKHELLLPIIYNSLVEYGKLKEGSIIKFTHCTCNIVHNVMYVSCPCSFFPLNEFHTVDASNVFVCHYSLT